MEQDHDQLHRNRRKDPRHAVDEPASVSLVHQGSAIACRIVDLSLGGCQIRAETPFLAGPMVRVEIVLKILGEVFRIAGVTRWTRQRQWVGIRFLDVSERKRAALTQLINEIASSRNRSSRTLSTSANPDVAD
jgi:c-di-GMP-binding flagellar brake protein YcgR